MPATEPGTAYRNSFEGNVPTGGSKHAAALAFAVDVRKFEIELYWKRAAYFWAFSALAFGAYVAALGSKDLRNKPEVLLLVSCLGLVFATAWYLVNRASKYWQLNWEMHVDLLEDDHLGPIYKTVLHDSPSIWSIAGAYPFSVSKINQLLSLFVVSIFAVLLAHTLKADFRAAWPPRLFPTGCLSCTAAFLVLFGWKGRVGNKNQLTGKAILRQTKLNAYGDEENQSPAASKTTDSGEATSGG